MRVFLLACVFLVAAVNFSLACECGMEGSAGRIYKGSKVRAHKYPWLAHIRSYTSRNSRSFSQCGGSLIDEQHIATAAHCVVDGDGYTKYPSNVDVFLGKVKAFSEYSEARSVSEIWVDPNYNRKDLSNDFAILTLSEPVKFSQQISPVCLPKNESGLSKLTVSGWGTTSAHSDSSDTLLEVDVSYLTHEQCNDIKTNFLFKQNGIDLSMKGLIRIPEVVETHMCAINKQTMGDACSGDSGGPLMKKGNNGLHYLMGVVSGSWTECGESTDTAGLYTRTLYYKDTIKSIAPNACWKD
ncbi:CLIP domain-containing serine protease B15-like [Panonychus citri]|uniref:CLIP domain-containing serine protease B15-like n=1 Tax=Panonychus citri TaxID=50023 RepID=UPI0023070E41|nr:CLIP domain-containing serine protease B15-like [Panonychus citri]